MINIAAQIDLARFVVHRSAIPFVLIRVHLNDVTLFAENDRGPIADGSYALAVTPGNDVSVEFPQAIPEVVVVMTRRLMGFNDPVRPVQSYRGLCPVVILCGKAKLHVAAVGVGWDGTHGGGSAVGLRQCILGQCRCDYGNKYQ